MPNTASPAGPLVVALLYDGLCTFEFGIVAEVFAIARPELGPGWYRYLACAEHRGRLATNAGISVQAEAGLEALDGAHTIIIPGWSINSGEPSPALREALLAAHDRGARLVTICSGVFLLAAIGLLEGRRAATHWRLAERLQSMHSSVTVDAGVLYAEDGGIFTSAGSAAGIDLLLHLVREDFGPDAANSVARRMVVAAHRSGGQVQFVERAVPARQESQLSGLLDRVREAPAHAWTVTEMADRAAMSTRTFVRRFRDATGTSPGTWLTQQRLMIARDLLETTSLSMDRIAEAAGIGTATNLRLYFTSHVGVPPSIYRKQFQRETLPTGATFSVQPNQKLSPA